MGAPLVAAKQQLRSLMKTKLSGVGPESVTSQSRMVFDTLKSFKPYEDAQRISIFLSMPAAEVQTDAIVRDALAAGKQVYVPYLHKSPFPPEESPPRVMDMVRLRDLRDYESLRPDKWGIPSIDSATVDERQRVLGAGTEPAPLESPLDLILVPGVAFDIDPQTGHLRRLGHGKGFYDFFIRRLSAKTDVPGHHGRTRAPVLCGLALAEQFLPEGFETPVPVAPHDKILDGVILGNGEIKRSSDGARLDT